MTKSPAGVEQRRHPRVALSKAARAKAANGELDGTIRDISASGASLVTDHPLEESAAIDLAVDGLGGEITGRVVRAFDDGVAIEFELEAAEEEALLREINALHAATTRADEF